VAPHRGANGEWPCAIQVAIAMRRRSRTADETLQLSKGALCLSLACQEEAPKSFLQGIGTQAGTEKKSPCGNSRMVFISDEFR